MEIRVGIFGRPHGLKGEIHLRVFHETGWHPAPGILIYSENCSCGNGPWTLTGVRGIKDAFLVTIEGIHDREKIALFTNSSVRAQIEKLPEHTFLIKDLVGSRVFSADGRMIGNLVRVIETKANDIFVIDNEKKEILIPALKSFIRRFDRIKKELIVDLPDGFEEHTSWPKNAG